MPRVIVFNKPFGVLSQFTDMDGHPGLGQYIDQPRFYAAGRLDRDSEGCLVLTDSGPLQQVLSDPKFAKHKTYLVQVEGIPDLKQLENLARGVELKDGRTRPATCEAIEPPPWLWPRNPPVRERKTVPDHWLKLQLQEGKNRQVRRMTAAVGLPTLRLIRWSVGPFDIAGIAPGDWDWREVPQDLLIRRDAKKNQSDAGKPARSFKGQVNRRGK